MAIHRRSFPSRAVVGACLILSSGWVPVAAGAAVPAISVAEPEGFADLAREQTLLVDVFFGGVRKGEATVTITPDTIKFADPVALIGLLPPLQNEDAIIALAAGGLPTNATRACSPSTDAAICGRLSPDTVGVIFDRDRFRVDVFLNPRFLAVQDRPDDKYLPTPEGRLSLINAIGAVYSGRTGRQSDSYYVQDQLLLAAGEKRVRADVSYADDFGFAAERLAVEWDRPELRYSAGAFWAPGNELSGRRKLLGLGLETQIDTRLDKDEILGNSVVVYLDRRAQVEVVRDGRVLSSAIYEAGNQQIDTATLPEGSYDIVLRIREAGRELREERRFYTKNRRIPAQGRTDFFVFGGMLIEGRDSGSLDPSGHPYLQAAVSRRVSEAWAIEGGVQASDESATIQLGATFLTRLARLRATAVAETEGGYGGILQLASSGASHLNFNIDLRHIDTGRTRRDGAAGPTTMPFGSPEFVPAESSYLQLGGVVSYSLANLRFLGTLFYRDEAAQQARYSIGPALEWDVLRKGAFALTLRGDLTATERGESGFAGVSLRWLGQGSSITALSGTRHSSIEDDDLGEGARAAVAGTWQASVAGGELAMGAGYEHQPRQDDLALSSDYRHRLGSLAGDFVNSASESGSVSQYSLGFQTTLAANAGGLQIAGRTASESVVVARVSGARESDRFDVLVNEQVAGTTRGSRSVAIALPAYRAYDVRLRPAGEDLLAYDGSSRNIASYPGVVTTLEWSAAPIKIKFGRLLFPDGTPIAGAALTGRGIWSETDEEGFFQVEAPDDAILTVTLRDGRSFAAALPPGQSNTGIARLGPIVCCGQEEIRLGALDALRGPGEGGSR